MESINRARHSLDIYSELKKYNMRDYVHDCLDISRTVLQA